MVCFGRIPDYRCHLGVRLCTDFRREYIDVTLNIMLLMARTIVTKSHIAFKAENMVKVTSITVSVCKLNISSEYFIVPEFKDQET